MQSDLCRLGEKAHFNEERMAGQPTSDGPPCGDEPIGESDVEEYEEPESLERI